MNRTQCIEWLATAASTIGAGFHPDTHSTEYVTALPASLAPGYDINMDRCFAVLGDETYTLALALIGGVL